MNSLHYLRFELTVYTDITQSNLTEAFERKVKCTLLYEVMTRKPSDPPCINSITRRGLIKISY